MGETKLEKIEDFFDSRSEIYEEKHLASLDGGLESKRSIAEALPDNTKTLLDLGVGTGLELEAIYERFPRIRITGIDISENLLSQLREKYKDADINVIQENYLSYDFGTAEYDAVISSMTMHHYDYHTKSGLYRKIKKALKSGGGYIENDYILSEKEMPDADAAEKRNFDEYELLRKEQNLSPGDYYHFDTPLTLNHQIEVLHESGFEDVHVAWANKHNITLTAK